VAAVAALSASLIAHGVSSAAAAAPGNDAFAAASPIAGMSGSISGSNVEASKEPGEPAHGHDRGGRSVWYRWTAPVSAQFVFDTCESGFDTLLAVYSGETVQALTEVASSDDACGTQSMVIVKTTAGTTYRIAVDGYDDDGDVAAGTFVLRWRTLSPPPNDDFGSAQEIVGTSGSAVGDNLLAGTEAGEPRHGTAINASIWYRWAAPFTGTAAFDTCGSSFDTVLAVYTGSAVGALRPFIGNDNACGTRSRVRFVAQAGTVYRIAVDGKGEQARGAVVLSWTLTAHPENDVFAKPRQLRGPRGSVAGSNEGALAEPNEPDHADSDPTASLWYRWRAPRTMGVSFDTCGARFDSVLAVYRGRTLRTLGEVDSDDDGCSEGAGSRVDFLARKGVEYRIVVDALGQGLGTFVLRWRPVGPSTGLRCIVPDVRGLTVARARAILERADCVLGRVVFAESAIVPAGRVIAQFPTPGRRLPFLSRVSVEVSRRGR
jgi:hypothetical protein